MDISRILDKPLNRKIDTSIISGKKIDKLISRLFEICNNGAQAYWVAH